MSRKGTKKSSEEKSDKDFIERNPILSVAILSTIGAIVGGSFLQWWNTKAPNVLIEYAILNIGTQPGNTKVGDLQLSFTPTDVSSPNLEVRASNTGSEVSEELEIVARGLSGASFSSVEERMSPFDERAAKRQRIPRLHPRELRYQFPIFKMKSEVTLSVHLSTSPRWKETFDLWAVDRRQQWQVRPAGIRLQDLLKRTWRLRFPWPLEAHSAEPAPPPLPPQSPRRRSGLILGGYDPIILSENTINLLLRYRIISQEDAASIMKEVSAPSPGPSFGSFNILKFDEVTINVLLSRGLITRTYAEGMLERSRKAPGTQINGINVIVLKASILQALFESGVVPLKEAQAALDSAKIDG